MNKFAGNEGLAAVNWGFVVMIPAAITSVRHKVSFIELPGLLESLNLECGGNPDFQSGDTALDFVIGEHYQSAVAASLCRRTPNQVTRFG